MCFCRSAGCSAQPGETGLRLRAEWSNSRTHCSRTDCSTLRPAGLGKKRQEKHEPREATSALARRCCFLSQVFHITANPPVCGAGAAQLRTAPPVSAGAIDEVDGSLAAFVLRYRPIPPPPSARVNGHSSRSPPPATELSPWGGGAQARRSFWNSSSRVPALEKGLWGAEPPVNRD